MPEATPSWLLAISIISTAIVSIVGVIVPLWLENQKANREDERSKEELRRASLAEIDFTALEFLRILSYFRVQTMRELDAAFTKSGIAVNTAQAGSVLQSQFYAWEGKVWKELSATDKQRLKTLRRDIEGKQLPYVWGAEVANPFAPDVSNIVEEVLTITRRATGRE